MERSNIQVSYKRFASSSRKRARNHSTAVSARILCVSYPTPPSCSSSMRQSSAGNHLASRYRSHIAISRFIRSLIGTIDMHSALCLYNLLHRTSRNSVSASARKVHARSSLYCSIDNRILLTPRWCQCIERLRSNVHLGLR